MTHPLFKINSFGFAVICPDKNFAGLKTTVNSIRCNYPGFPYLGVVGSDASDEQVKEMNGLCETVVGGSTITSLMNEGIRNIKTEWVGLVFGGSWLRPYFYRKFSLFVKSEKDILFPVVDRKMYFFDGSMNGIILNRKFFLKIGDFPTSAMQKYGYNDLEMIKLFWSFQAIEQGCNFKAVVGMKIC